MMVPGKATRRVARSSVSGNHSGSTQRLQDVDTGVQGDALTKALYGLTPARLRPGGFFIARDATFR